MNHLQRVLTPTDTGSSHGDCRSDADLDAILDATELDMGGRSFTTIPRDVSGLSDNERSESMVDRRSENSQSEGRGFDSRGRFRIMK